MLFRRIDFNSSFILLRALSRLRFLERGFDEADLLCFFVAVVTDEVPLVASRMLLQLFASELNKLEPEAHKEIAQYALAQIQPRVVSFEEQVLYLVCCHYASIFSACI